jgi:preprotein translocase subunit Sss1
MSARDLNDLLNTPKLFLFLPAVNHTVLVATTARSHEFVLCLLALGSSAVVYNILDGIPVEQADMVSLPTTAFFILGGVGWLITVAFSLHRLKDAFSQSPILHEILFFGTVGFIFVVLSHIVLRAEDEYDNTF